jgi:metal-responsive CopG/Arc/MetJ family transcriptional regulator
MKIVVSLPDELFDEADRLAKRLKRSRKRTRSHG